MGIWTPGPGATEGDDTFDGNNTSETASGLGGDDVLNGAGGSDTLNGNAGNDVLNGGDSIDRLDGGDGDDTLIGGASFDTLTGGAGADFMDGGADIDRVVYSLSDAGVNINLALGTASGGHATGDTLVSIENITGSSFADVLIGNGFDNSLNGGAGADTYDGGDGVDLVSYSGSAIGVIANLVTPASNTGEAAGDVYVSIESLFGSTHADTLIGDDGANVLDGNSGDDIVNGGAGDDVLRGSQGVDALDGGAGIDTADYSFELTGGVTVNLQTGVSTDSLGASDTLANIENVIGSGFADALTGDAGTNVLMGGGGADALDGGDGVDTAIYQSSVIADLADPSANFGDEAVGDTYVSIENITGSIQSDALRGDEGANVLVGGGGIDTLEGRDGADVLDGGSEDDALDGGADADTLDGGDGDDSLDGGAGADVMTGGAGDDTYFVDDVGDVTSETSPADGVDTVVSSITFTLGSNLENLVLVLDSVDPINGFGNGLDNSIDGNRGDNQLYGFDGNDLIDGNSGADLMFGGAGDDFYVFDDPGDLIFEDSGMGTDSVFSNMDYTLPDNVENLSLSNIFGTITGVGNALNNVIRGGDFASGALVLFGLGGDDTLVGGGGVDALDGGDGIDTASYENAAGAAGVLLSSGGVSGVAAGDTYTSIENVRGSAFGDSITGDANANVLEGLAGNDVLEGGAGADTLIGGLGDDTYVVDNAGDAITELSGEGVDTVQSSLTRSLGNNLENLVLTGAAAINGFGNALDNVIAGNAAANQLNGFDGNDTLDGGADADAMFGGNGDDIYIVDNTGDVAAEVSALGGIDTVMSSLSRNLTANIENLTLTGAADIAGAGNALNNVIVGNAGANTLYGFEGNDRVDGGAGADTLFGAAGDDAYVVDDVGDITVEGISGAAGGVDTVESSVSRNLNANFENLVLTGPAQFGYGNILDNVMTGNGAANGLYGFDGNDRLDGGAGADQMFGGNGDDVYVVDDAGDVTSEVSALGGVDTVLSSVTRNLTANLENLTLTGNAAISGAGNVLDNVIIGNSAANTLFGLDGADTLDGGLGADALQGGAGADAYVFSSALGGGNVDTIVNFSVVDDTIQLNNSVFTGLAEGILDASAFHIGASAADADDRIIYDSATGALYFDADGDGAAAQIQFGILAAGLGLTNADFIVGGS